MAAVRREWKPDPNDAINLAALRWFAVTLERVGIEVYATDRKKFARLDALLKRQMREIYDLAKSASVAEDGEDCPDGWIKCRDGLCAQICDPEPAEQ